MNQEEKKASTIRFRVISSKSGSELENLKHDRGSKTELQPLPHSASGSKERRECSVQTKKSWRAGLHCFAFHIQRVEGSFGVGVIGEGWDTRNLRYTRPASPTKGRSEYVIYWSDGCFMDGINTPHHS